MTNKDCFYILMLFVVLAAGLACGHKIGKTSKYHGVSEQMEYRRVK